MENGTVFVEHNVCFVCFKQASSNFLCVVDEFNRNLVNSGSTLLQGT